MVCAHISSFWRRLLTTVVPAVMLGHVLTLMVRLYMMYHLRERAQAVQVTTAGMFVILTCRRHLQCFKAPTREKIDDEYRLLDSGRWMMMCKIMSLPEFMLVYGLLYRIF